jgi:hypothetical protein
MIHPFRIFINSDLTDPIAGVLQRYGGRHSVVQPHHPSWVSGRTAGGQGQDPKVHLGDPFASWRNRTTAQ